MQSAAPWIAAMLTAGAVVLSVAVLSARSLFGMSIALSATVGLAACALLALNGGDGALNLVLAGAGLIPIILLAGVLLSAPAAKSQQRGVLWVCVAAAALAIGLVVAITPELIGSATSRQAPAPAGVWLAALMACMTAGVVALLGYDERGVLEAREP